MHVIHVLIGIMTLFLANGLEDRVPISLRERGGGEATSKNGVGGEP